MVIWDYFMRRKWLLLAVLAVFMISGTVSGYFLQHSDTYVVDNAVLNQPEEVEENSGATVARVKVPILSEEEATVVAITNAIQENMSDVEQSQPDTNTDNSVQIAGTSVSDNSNIDVPLTGGVAQTDINEAWRSLFVVWQQATWSIIGALVLAIFLVLLARWMVWQKIH